MSKRLASSAMLVWLLCTVLVAAPAALAVEGEEGSPEQEELPSIEEVGTQSETSREFFPEAYESPSALTPMIWLLLGVGIVLLVLALALYLVWQPRFAEERKQKSRR